MLCRPLRPSDDSQTPDGAYWPQINVNFRSSPSHPWSPSFSSASSDSSSTRLNHRRRRQSSVTSRSRLVRLDRRLLTSKHPFAPNESVNPTLDGDVLLVHDGATE